VEEKGPHYQPLVSQGLKLRASERRKEGSGTLLRPLDDTLPSLYSRTCLSRHAFNNIVYKKKINFAIFHWLG